MRFLGLTGRELVSRAWDRSEPDRVLLHDTSAVYFEYALGTAGAWSVLRSGSLGASVGDRDILMAPTDSLARARPFLATNVDEMSPVLSPDGRLVAYVSDESGTQEVFVQPIPGPGPRLQISLAGGGEPIWSPQGGAIFYRAPDRQIVAARLSLSPLRVTAWDTLFVDRFVRSGATSANWSVFPNGRDFLLLGGPATDGRVKVVLNWPRMRGIGGGPGSP